MQGRFIDDFLESFSDYQIDLHHQIAGNGFWEDGVDLNIIGMKLALIHSEVSEALEELRKDADPLVKYYRADGKPEGFRYELADAVIRIMDLAEATGVDLADAIVEKDTYNRTRPYKHGKTA